MSPTSSELLEQALLLSDEDRLTLATKLIASVDGPPEPDWQATWLTELDRRVTAAHERGESGSEWTEVRARILAQLGR